MLCPWFHPSSVRRGQNFTNSKPIHSYKFCYDLSFTDVDYCQLYGCYSDAYITLNCTDLPPPSTFIACDPCPEGLESRINGVECNTDGQCCVGKC